MIKRNSFKDCSHIFIIKEMQSQIGAMKNEKQKFIVGPANEIKIADPAKSSIQENDEDDFTGDLFYSLRTIFIFGRLIGLIPLSGIFRKHETVERLSFRWMSLAALMNVVILILLAANVILSFLDLFRQFAGAGGGNASEMAKAARNPLFYLMAIFMYTFFLFRSEKLITLFKTWRRVTSDLDFKNKDTQLFKCANYIAGAILISATVESFLQNVNSILPAQNETNKTFNDDFEKYFWHSHKFWAEYVSYNPLLTLLLFFTNKLALLAWNYVDVLIVLLSRGLYFKFQVLVLETFAARETTIMLRRTNGKNRSWANVRKDHLTLCKLLDELDEFLSPLIFLSYGINTYFLCLQLHQGLTPSHNRTIMESVHSAVSFIQLVGRILAVSLSAAKINEYAHKITNCLQKCRTNEYCNELERLERMLATGPIGLSGLGCFVITRAFMLVLTSLIFTSEIILLQAASSSSATTCQCYSVSPDSKN